MISKRCIGKIIASNRMDEILQSTPKIGVSHLNVSENLVDNTNVLRIFLLSMRKAFTPSLRGPQPDPTKSEGSKYCGDSEYILHTSSMKMIQVPHMSKFQLQTFRDIEKIVECLNIFEDNKLISVVDMLFMTKYNVQHSVKKKGRQSKSLRLTVSYPHIDIITDVICNWYQSRRYDRVSKCYERSCCVWNNHMRIYVRK